MQTKVTINIERGVSYDFQFSDEITYFRVPYIFFLHQNFVKVISPLTNKIVKTIDFASALIGQDEKLLKKKVSAAEMKK